MRAQPRTSLLTKASQSVISWYNWAESFIYPNRAVDPVHVGILSEFGPFMQHFWTGSRAEVWDLTLLGVDPVAHGNGHGKQLASWGFEKAKEEGIGCSVVASEGKSGFYQKCGFDVVAGDAKDEGGMRNPLNRENIPGGAILFWDNGRSPGHVQMSTLK
jgi:GNAT superfamily N-acetyltransferase